MRKYEYRIWDKKTEIKGRTASKWLELYPEFNNGEVFVVAVDGIDFHINNLDSIRSTLDMNANTNEEVMQQFVDNLINDREQEPIYVHENAELKTELSQAKLLLMKEGLL